MYDTGRGHGGTRRRRGAEPAVATMGERPTGRHAFDEDAALTPIFHALTRGGWRSRQHEPAAPPPDAVDAFRRDPLTAPIPVQAFENVAASVIAGRRAAAGAPVRPANVPGRHRQLAQRS